MTHKDTIEVGVRELKARLSQYLRMVKAGRVVTVTEYGKPIGRMLPYGQSVEDSIRAAQEAGVVAWSGRRWRPAGPVARIRGKKTVAQIIVEDRN